MSIVAVKYLYKYVYKGHDHGAFVPVEQRGDGHPDAADPDIRDEISDYIDGRYVGPHEAFWRILGFSLHDNTPSVICLQCHLPDHQPVCFNPETDTIESIIGSDAARRTSLTEFFIACQKYPVETRGLTYDCMPEKFVWNKGSYIWTPRKNTTMAYGRIYFAPPNVGERYFLRTLLCTVPAPTSYEFLRTVNGITYPTFKEACGALGLLANDGEYDLCLQEAGHMATGRQLQHLFATILLDCEPQNPQKLWDDYWQSITDDCSYILSSRGLLTTITPEHIKSYGLLLVDNKLCAAGKSLRDYKIAGPTVSFDFANEDGRQLIAAERSFNYLELQNHITTNLPLLNSEQRHVFDSVVEVYESGKQETFFLDGPGGTGKTFVENLILAYVCSKGDIALAVASTGIASILLANGHTSYSRFKIPLNTAPDAFCAIPRQSHLAELLRLVRLIIWDEITMQTRFSVEAVEHTMRDIRQSDDLFGGCPVLFSGWYLPISFCS